MSQKIRNQAQFHIRTAEGMKRTTVSFHNQCNKNLDRDSQ